MILFQFVLFYLGSAVGYLILIAFKSANFERLHYYNHQLFSFLVFRDFFLVQLIQIQR